MSVVKCEVEVRRRTEKYAPLPSQARVFYSVITALHQVSRFNSYKLTFLIPFDGLQPFSFSG